MSDYISREKAIKSICQYGTAQERIGRYAVTISELKQTVADTLSDLPSADVRENVKGEWILDYRDGGVEFYHCSKCNLGRAVIDGDYYKSLDEFKKCPICGADMRGET